MKIPSARRTFHLGFALLIAATTFPLGHSAFAAATTWANTGTDFNTANDWNNGLPDTATYAVFSQAESTQPNVGAPINVIGLQFVTGGYDIASANSSALTLTSTSTTAAATAIYLNGAGETNTLDATLPVVLGSATGTSATTTFSGAASGSLLAASGILNLNAAMSGVNLLSYTGYGTYNISATNTYSGGTSIAGAAAGALQLNVSNASAFGSGALSITAGNLDNTSTGALTIANALTVKGSFTYLGTGGENLTLSGATTLTATPTITVGAQTLTFSNTITGGTFGITKTGAGTLSLSAANSYSGTTSINAGTVLIGSNTSLGSGTISFGGGTLAAASTVGAAHAVANNFANLTSGGSASIGGSNNITLSGTLTAASGAGRYLLNTNSATTALTGNIFLSSSASTAGGLNVSNSGGGNLTLGGSIADYNGTASVGSGITYTANANTGTITISGANSYSGGTTFGNNTAGTFVLGSSTPFGAATGMVTFNNDTFSANTDLSGTNAIANPYTVPTGTTPVFNGNNNLQLSGATTLTGSRTLTSNITAAAGTMTTPALILSGIINLGAVNSTGVGVTFNGSGNTTVSNTIQPTSGNTGADTVSYSGSGTLTLSGTNTYTGTTSVTSGGTLLANGGGTTGSSTGTGAVSVTAGSILGGTGRIATTAGVTIGSATAGATITGAGIGSIGTLTLISNTTLTGNASSKTAFYVDLGNTTTDQLAITGILALGANTQITLNQLSGTVIQPGTYQLATYTSETGALPTIVGETSNESVFLNSYGIELDLTVSAVPEPSTLLAGIFACGLLGLNQRRRIVAWVGSERARVA